MTLNMKQFSSPLIHTYRIEVTDAEDNYDGCLLCVISTFQTNDFLVAVQRLRELRIHLEELGLGLHLALYMTNKLGTKTLEIE